MLVNILFDYLCCVVVYYQWAGGRQVDEQADVGLPKSLRKKKGHIVGRAGQPDLSIDLSIYCNYFGHKELKFIGPSCVNLSFNVKYFLTHHISLWWCLVDKERCSNESAMGNRKRPLADSFLPLDSVLLKPFQLYTQGSTVSSIRELCLLARDIHAVMLCCVFLPKKTEWQRFAKWGEPHSVASQQHMSVWSANWSQSGRGEWDWNYCNFSYKSPCCSLTP